MQKLAHSAGLSISVSAWYMDVRVFVKCMFRDNKLQVRISEYKNSLNNLK